MDVFNKSYTQLVDLFRSMTVGARMATVLLLVLALVSVAYLFNHQSGGPDAYLMGGEMFSAAELREMEAAFGKANLHAAQVDGGRIKVPRGQQSVYMAALADAGAMPVEFGDFMKKAASNTSFIPPNRQQQEALTKSARNHDLQVIINRMRGIEKCAVQIDEKLEKSKASLYDQTILTASVSVQTLGGRPLDEMQVTAIRGLVASSVAGMKPAAVTVVDLVGGRLFAGNGGADVKPGGPIGDYADYKRRHEQDWQQKIIHVLSYIPDVVVTTNVELDPEVVNEQKSTEYDAAKAVIFKSREVPRGSDTPTAAPRPDPSERDFLRRPASVLTGESLNHEDTPGAVVQERAIPTTERFVVREGRTPTRVTVSVAVPSSYFEKIWRRQHAAANEESQGRPDATEFAALEEKEKRKIEAAVMTLLPVPAVKSADAAPQVIVSTFYQISQPSLPVATAADETWAWMGEHWSTVGAILLALVSLVILRGIVGRAPASVQSSVATVEPRDPSPLSQDVDREESPGPVDWKQPRRRFTTGPQLRDELADVVRDDPAAAVSILRTWIGNAS